MKTRSSLLRTKIGALAGVSLAILGLLPVSYLVALLAWQFSALFETGSWVALPATLLFTDHSSLQSTKASPALEFIPQFPWPWLMNPESLLPIHNVLISLLGRFHVGLVFGLLGVAVIAIGVRWLRQHMSALRIVKQQRLDSLRRVQDYRLDEQAFDGRREPYIGTGDARRVA